MRVNIKKYPTWIGTYQLVSPLRYVGVTEENRDRLAEWLSETWIGYLLIKIYSWQNNRRVTVKVHPYDAWNANNTLAYIILPVLKELQKDKQGSPNVDDEDVPDNLKRTSAPTVENKWDTDDNWHLRWEYVLNEMIWAFEQYNSDWEEQFWIQKPEIDLDHDEVNDDGSIPLKWKVEGILNQEGMEAHRKRMTNGFRLFGKYYECLWS